MKKRNDLRIVNVLDKSLRGWLPVTDINNNKLEIFYTTKIKPIGKNQFEILEGYYKSRIINVDYSRIYPRLFTSYTDKLSLKQEQCFIFVEQKNNRLIYKNNEIFNEIPVVANNIQHGIYSILFPYRRHTDKVSLDYLNEHKSGSRFAETWFPIMKSKFEFQYIHFGKYSNGCVTFIGSGEEWSKLYKYIISSRKNTNIHGILSIGSTFDEEIEQIKKLSLDNQHI